jgi:hypothetical protein
MQTEDIKDKAEDLLEHTGDYLETYYKLGLVTLTQKVSIAASSVVSIIAIVATLIFVLFFAGFGLSWWLGDLVGSRTGGFLLTGGFFLLLLLILLALRKKILFPYIRNTIIRNLYD